MKKLTAGILTVMLGVVAANSANAAIPSTAYVDAKAKTNADAIALKANTADVYTQAAANAKFETQETASATKTELEGKISTVDGKFANYTTTTDMNTELGKKQNKLTAGTNIEIKEDGTISTVGIATTEGLTDLTAKVGSNTAAITKLNGTATEDGSVAKSIADAITELNLGNTYEAKGAADAVKTELTTEIGKKADKATTLAGYGITDAYTKTEVGTELDKKQNKLTAENLVGGDNVTVSIADGKITIAADKYDETALKTAVEKNTSDITTINDSAVMKSGITADKVTTYNGYAATIQANTEAAAAAQSTANVAKTTAEAAIPAPAADKIGSNAKYVLTWDSTIGYQWEDISRTAE